MKVLYIFLFVSISCIKLNDITFEKVITDLGNLESYIKEYMKEKSYSQTSLTHLIVAYIRLGGYSTKEWTIAGGSIPDDLAEYIKSKDTEKGTSAQATQTYRDMVMPNGDKLDFVHMFAVMNGIEFGKSYSGNYAPLVGWGGDTEQLLEDIMNQQGDIESLMEIAKTQYFRIKGGFDEGDLIADLDATILLNQKNDDNNFADLMKEYYIKVQIEEERVTQFVELSFPSLIGQKDKELFRNVIFKVYTDDMFIKVLECKAGLRDPRLTCYIPEPIKEQYAPHQKAAVYVVSDYFFENYNPSTPSEEEEESESREDEKEDEKEGEKEHEKEHEKEDEGEGSDTTEPTDDSKFINNKFLYLVSRFGLF